MSFTFSKTDQFMTPSLAPTTIIIEEGRFDIDLRRKCGEPINGFFTKKGDSCSAYKPKPDSGYDPETEVIVCISFFGEKSVIVGNNTDEHYVFRLTDWQRVYEIGKAKEPLERRREPEPSRGTFE